MATLREYFDVDIKCMTLHADWGIEARGTKQLPIRAKIALDFDGNARYWSFFIPDGADVGEYIQLILNSPQTAQCVLSPEGDGVCVEAGFADYSEKSSSATFIFTKRVFLYVDALLTREIRAQITKTGADHGFFIVVRDREYALKRSEYEKPLAFISHDSRDKDALVRELAFELSKLMCPVWYDEYSLTVGDSLRASIERGLKETRKCIVVLSPHFLANGRWARAEFDSVFTREILENTNIFLPVWHNVGVHEIFQYSPRLADKVGLNSALGVKKLAKRLCGAIKQAGPRQLPVSAA